MLYLRLAANLTRTAELSVQHAARYQQRGNWHAAAIELQRAKQARSAAEHARRFAWKLREERYGRR